MATSRMNLFAGLLHVHATVVDAVEAELRAAHDIGLTEYEVLLRLAQSDGRMRMSDLAELALLSKSGLTRLIERMETSGLVRRTSCAADRRGTFAELTPAGRKSLERTRATVEQAVEAHFASALTETEADTLHEVFKRLLAGHDRALSLLACALADEKALAEHTAARG